MNKKLEYLKSDSWIIESDNTDKSKNINTENNMLSSDSNILAYNNNALDKTILIHAYQQRFGEVTTHIKCLTTSTMITQVKLFKFLLCVDIEYFVVQRRQYLEWKTSYVHVLCRPRIGYLTIVGYIGIEP